MEINPKDISISKLQGYLQGAVAPRPVAFVSSIDKKGNVNLSPFSFFNIFGSNPPILIFAPNRRLRDASQKDTFLNILETKEVVVNMVHFEMVEQMSLASAEYPKRVDEFLKAGLSPIHSQKVAPPRVAECKVAFECVVKQIIETGVEGGAGNLIICEVVYIHISDDILNNQGQIDPLLTDWVARSGGDYYIRANAQNMYAIPKPNQKIGIGIDALPEWIFPYFNKSELARLANVTAMPHSPDILEKSFDTDDLLGLAKHFLRNNDLENAWIALLIFNKNGN
jgi:flavin reductase (DIM6/NTAB) family NADH-FMN oxidoreductase RutF